VPYVHAQSTTPNLHLQTGTSVLCGLIAFLLLKPRERVGSALFLATVFSILMVVSIFHILPMWRFFPVALTVIQFPYRLLIFVIVFGNILFALTLQQALRQRRHVLAAVLLIAAVASALIFFERPALSPLKADAVEASDFVHHDYREVGGEAAKPDIAVARPDIRASWNAATYSTSLDRSAFVQLPILYSGRLHVTDNGQPARMYQAGDALVLSLNRGEHRIKVVRRETTLGRVMFFLAVAAILPLVLWPRRWLPIWLLPTSRQPAKHGEPA
jgi:hypothetical protein